MRSNVKRGAFRGTAVAVICLLLAAALCLAVEPPTPGQLAGVFAFEGEPIAGSRGSLELPSGEWFVVTAGGRAVAASASLLSAEMLREPYGDASSIERIELPGITLNVTANARQLAALEEGTASLYRTLTFLEGAAQVDATRIRAAAEPQKAMLDGLCQTLSDVLTGVENPVVRGLSGLVFSARDAYATLLQNPTGETALAQLAQLVRQWEAYAAFLQGQAGGQHQSYYFNHSPAAFSMGMPC